MAHILNRGGFVRVRADHPDGRRAGKDAMVMSVDGEDLGLYFGLDRANRPQDVFCSGTEAWKLAELDLATADA
ncbi:MULTISPECIES: hypothetical protein [unclassified Variovorax]|uniref:hypothetical protein n=1 Tax=unclassified Variovorax TaxID=663243 RepID=UPI00131987A5|nr:MULTISPECIES: hypothetical protein [unclassified Variovorax]VTU42542.1 hypothetical protein H6P1_00217 [Variovorax sp. PBL-H6]VTU43856.1 hypothetical protein SRS16P1_00685 [Variovorax sp. SRS16]VTU43920.1 hypothetical protein E5P1_00678 [Variovorax sp. PBL-E5]